MGDCYTHIADLLISAFNVLYFTDGRSLFTTAFVRFSFHCFTKKANDGRSGGYLQN